MCNINSWTELPQLKYKAPRTWSRQYHNKTYIDKICAFDIETTVIDTESGKQSIMYVWQFAIGTDYVIIGRTWDEFKKLVKWLRSLAGGHTIPVFVHNLSYEFQWLSGQFHFENKDVFCTESRKILKCDLYPLEIRCSYLLSNLSLKDLTARYHVEHEKIDGEQFDYNKKRFPWTPLSDLEKQYIINDVVGLVECIHAIMQLHDDDIYTLPLTSTGFVRRICRERMRENRELIQEIYPNYDIFQMLRAEFRGGNTHANRYYAGEVIRERITSMDISSSYPSAQCNRLYPVTAFREIKNISARKIDNLIDRNYAVLFEVELTDIKLRDRYWSVPYIPLAKCSYYDGIRNDNGRILSAKKIIMTVNDIDWKIIVTEYTFTAHVLRGYRASYGPLPDAITKSNIEFFRLKTELRGIEGQELYYHKNKELLNSIYGMSCQNPAKGTILFNNCAYDLDESKTEKELLKESRRRAFLAYQFGCWTTAHARAALEAGITICGDNLLYVDTDSCKFIGDADFTDYNREQKAASEKSGLYAKDKKGVIHYGGVYEFDGEYTAFVTQGAKKYAYEDAAGLHLTVSGVGKKKGAAYLAAHGGLDAFMPGFVFPACGKTRSIYNDDGAEPVIIDGHKIDISRNVVIEEQEYTLSRTKEYNTLLNETKRFLLKVREIYKNTNYL